jgi:hypothetical protein
MKWRWVWSWFDFAAVLAVGALSVACRPMEPPPTVLGIEGIIEQLRRLPDGSVEITLVFSDRHGMAIRGVGTLTSETEVMINGIAAGAEQFRVGERIRGYVRIDRMDGERKLVAMRLHAERDEAVMNAPDPTTLQRRSGNKEP